MPRSQLRNVTHHGSLMVHQTSPILAPLQQGPAQVKCNKCKNTKTEQTCLLGKGEVCTTTVMFNSGYNGKKVVVVIRVAYFSGEIEKNRIPS